MNVALEGMPYLQRKELNILPLPMHVVRMVDAIIYIYIYIIVYFIRLIGNTMYGIEAFGDYSLDNVGCIFRVILGR
ncbi:MAG: hypothetical protein WA421_18065 [Nitrososphaeraceae archaeon]